MNPLLDPPSAAPLSHPAGRVQTVDILRGLVMVIMALDHVREFWSATPYRPEDLSQSSVALFLTRWVTHFCAPTFVFLSGVSIFLYERKKQNRRKVSFFLLTRGLWLVVLEVVVISFFLEWKYDLILLQVIWVIGWSMIILAGLIRLPRPVIGAVALLLIAGHQLIPAGYTVTAANAVWALLYHTPFVLPLPVLPPLLVAYTIAVWLGVMAAGYWIGPWFTLPAGRRKQWLARAGVGVLAVFVLVRSLNGFGDPAPWSIQTRGFEYSVLSFLNVSKYPPSLLFLCLTLGTGLWMLAALEGAANRLTEWLRTFGKVPFFFYLLHLPLISLGAVLWSSAAFGRIVNFSFVPPAAWPPEYQPSLIRVYLVWICLILLLYFPCRWYGRYREQHRHWWLSYL